MRLRTGLLAAAAAALVGCATGEKIAREVLKDSPEGRKILGEFDRYKKLANVFLKYHDGQPLDDKDLVELLKSAGLAKSIKVPPKGRPAPPPEPAPETYPVPKYIGPYRWPLDAGIVSSEFGTRWNKPHRGVDIAADIKVPVYTIAPGEVVYAGDKLSGYGNIVVVKHDEKTTTFYAHNHTLKVKSGDRVVRNQVIALLGSTGRSTGPHVHFEIREKNLAVDPRQRLPKTRF